MKRDSEDVSRNSSVKYRTETCVIFFVKVQFLRVGPFLARYRRLSGKNSTLLLLNLRRLDASVRLQNCSFLVSNPFRFDTLIFLQNYDLLIEERKASRVSLSNYGFFGPNIRCFDRFTFSKNITICSTFMLIERRKVSRRS